MCTLTFLPSPNGYLFTSNRDEIISREPAAFPVYQYQNDLRLLMPLDTQGGGTWILVSESGDAACLLNGAFENHQRRPPYRKSRGKVIVESFAYASIRHFLEDYDFDQIEPFTLVKVLHQHGREVHVIRWDGKQLQYNEIDANKPHIWSSVTLYDEKMREKRQQWFDNWLATGINFTVDSIRDFHLNGGEGDPSVDFKMTRSGGLQTLSLSCVFVDNHLATLDYYNLRTKVREKAELEVAKRAV